MPAAGFVFTGIIAVVSGDANSNLEKGMPVVGSGNFKLVISKRLDIWILGRGTFFLRGSKGGQLGSFWIRNS
jgi:hypothetical protein